MSKVRAAPVWGGRNMIQPPQHPKKIWYGPHIMGKYDIVLSKNMIKHHKKIWYGGIWYYFRQEYDTTPSTPPEKTSPQTNRHKISFFFTSLTFMTRWLFYYSSIHFYPFGSIFINFHSFSSMFTHFHPPLSTFIHVYQFSPLFFLFISICVFSPKFIGGTGRSGLLWAGCYTTDDKAPHSSRNFPKKFPRPFVLLEKHLVLHNWWHLQKLFPKFCHFSINSNQLFFSSSNIFFLVSRLVPQN